MEENRRIPPPPRPIPPRPPQVQNTQTTDDQVKSELVNSEQIQNKKSKPKREPLSEQTKNALFYCGGALSFVLAVVCLILIFVL